jgi:hypothetical protein
MRYILILLLLTSCSLSEVLEMPKPRTKTDTTYIPRQLDTTETSDIPIGFEVTIEDWEDTEIDINL